MSLAVAVFLLLSGTALASVVAGFVAISIARRRIRELEADRDKLQRLAADNIIAREAAEEALADVSGEVVELRAERDALMTEVETKRHVRRSYAN